MKNVQAVVEVFAQRPFGERLVRILVGRRDNANVDFDFPRAAQAPHARVFEHAQQLGVNVERTKLLLIVAASLATAAAVSFSGLIGFVGLIAPHTVRLLWGVDYRALLPMAAIVGAAFLILADLVARTVASPAELPVGVVTAFCGAPFFLYLLRRRRQIAM